MEKKELIRDMEKQTGGASFITMTQLAGWIGVDRHTARRYVDGLERVDGKYYFVPDVAEKLRARIR